MIEGAASGTGDLATWLGAAGTWAVGILAAIIAAVQYRNSIFRPRIYSYIQSDRRRIALRVINEGGAAGMVERVELVTDDPPLIEYEWEGWDQCDPVPFILPGKASAILLLTLSSPAAANVKMIVRYGNGKDSRRIRLKQVNGHISEGTVLPPDSLAIRVPPIDSKRE